MLPLLAWRDFHARSRFARSAIPEEKWGLLVVLEQKKEPPKVTGGSDPPENNDPSKVETSNIISLFAKDNGSDMIHILNKLKATLIWGLLIMII